MDSIFTEESLNEKNQRIKGMLLPRKGEALAGVYVTLAIIFTTLLLLAFMFTIPRTVSLQGKVVKDFFSYESSSGGHVVEVHTKLGSHVSVGDLILTIKKEGNQSRFETIAAIRDSTRKKLQMLEDTYQLKKTQDELRKREYGERLKGMDTAMSSAKKELKLYEKLFREKSDVLVKIRKIDLIGPKDIHDVERDVSSLQSQVTKLKSDINDLERAQFEMNNYIRTSDSMLRQTQSTFEYEMDRISAEERQTINENFIVVKSEVDGIVNYLPYKLNDLVAKDSKVVQIDYSNNQLAIVLESSQTMLMDEDVRNSEFILRYLTVDGTSRAFKARPVEVDLYKSTYRNLNPDDHSDGYIIKFRIDEKTIKIDGRELALQHGVPVKAVLALPYRRTVFGELAAELRDFLSDVFKHVS